MNNIKEQLIEVRNLLQGHILVLIIILVIVIGIPVTFYLAKQQQDLRSKATDAGSLVFLPATPTGSVNINSAFDLNFGINLNPAARITGVDVTITYTNNLRLDTLLKDTAVLPEEVLNNSNPVVNPRTVHYVAVSKSGDLYSRTYVPLGKLTFTAIGAGSATITITNNQIVAKDQAGTLAIGNTTTTYTVAGPANGVWSAWSGGICTVTCGGGTLTGETRTCSAPAAGGTECTKLDDTLTTPTNRTETRSAVTACNAQACTVTCINGDTGDNGCVDINDYNTWSDEFTGAVTTKTADFYPECNSSNQKGDEVIDINDYNIWRREFDARRHRCP